MAATVTDRRTLDITFHISDGTAVGDSLTWKLNNPSSSVTTLQNVRDAFGGDSGFLSDYFTQDSNANPNQKMYICDASGNRIDNVDAAKKVSVVTTKEDLG